MLGVEDGDDNEVFVVVTVVTSLLFDDEVLAPVGLGDVVFDDIVVAVVVSFLFVVEPTLVGVTSVSVQNKIRVKIDMEDKKTLLYCIMRAGFSKWLPLDPKPVAKTSLPYIVRLAFFAVLMPYYIRFHRTHSSICAMQEVNLVAPSSETIHLHQGSYHVSVKSGGFSSNKTLRLSKELYKKICSEKSRT